MKYIKWVIILLFPIALCAIVYYSGNRGLELTETQLCLDALNGGNAEQVAQQSVSQLKNNIESWRLAFCWLCAIIYYVAVGHRVIKKQEMKG